MKKMRMRIFLIIIISLLVLLSSCGIKSNYEMKINLQANTQWESENGTILFNVDDKPSATGTIMANGENISVCMVGTARAASVEIYPVSILSDSTISESIRYERWRYSYISENKCIVTVEESTFFKVGDQITFLKKTD